MAVVLAGCTLTAAGREENRQVARLVFQLDPADYGAEEIDCLDVPWVDEVAAEQFFSCWKASLADGEVRATASAIGTDLAALADGPYAGEVCGNAGGAEVQCAGFATMPKARNANVEIWVSLPDDAVAQLAPGASAGTYYVTFALVPYGPDHYQED